MAKKGSKIASTLDKAAATVGRALGQVAHTVESIPAYRAEAAAELDHVLDVAHEMQHDMSSVPADLKHAATTTVHAAKQAATTTVHAARRVAATTVQAAKRARQSLSSKGRAKAIAAARKRLAGRKTKGDRRSEGKGRSKGRGQLKVKGQRAKVKKGAKKK